MDLHYSQPLKNNPDFYMHMFDQMLECKANLDIFKACISFRLW